MKTSIAEWGNSKENLVDWSKPMHPVLEAYVEGRGSAKHVDLWRFLKKLGISSRGWR